MEEKKVYKANEFSGFHKCNKGKLLQEVLPVETKKEEAYDNAIIVNQILKGLFTGEFDESELTELVSEGIEENNLPDETNKKRQERLVNCLRRAWRCEWRKKYVTVCEETKEIIISQDPEIIVGVKPAVVFDVPEDKKADAPRVIEAVKYINSKPRITQNGKKAELSVAECPELYLLFLYAKSLLKPGEKALVKGSFYYMRKSTDTSVGFRDPDFFSGGGNIVSFEKEVDLNNDTLSKEELSYIDQIKASVEGKQCTEEDCKHCKFNVICNYNKAPVAFERKTGKKGGKIVLSPEQEAIVNAREGVYRVIAAAGSGKTECVTERGARMLIEGTNPSEILFITFTDAGAKEMKARISGKCAAYGLDVDPEEIQATTFNAFAYNIVKAHYDLLGFDKEPAVIDEIREKKIIAGLLNQQTIPGLDYLNFKSNTPSLKGALVVGTKAFQLMKAEGIDSTDVKALEAAMKECGMYRFAGSAIPALASLYDEYCEQLKEDNLLTFADQEPLMFEVLEQKPEYLDSLGFKHIIVDEFQDSNWIQMETIKKLWNTSCAQSLMVVGDDSQSIYGFRHTSPENIIHFFEKMGITGESITLPDNRRSTPQILDLANKINALNIECVEKDMKPVKEDGAPVTVKGFYNRKDEITYVCDEIKRLIEEEHEIPEDIAYIGYSNAELIAIGSELSQRGVPWIMMNPMPLMENGRVKAAIALADAFYQPDADKLYLDYLAAKFDGKILECMSFEEINDQIAVLKQEFSNIDSMEIPLQRMIFHQYLDSLKDEDKPDELFDYFLDLLYQNPDLQSELEYIQDFKIYGDGCAKKLDSTYVGVVLTTAHSSKGLEWKYVFNSLSSYDCKFFHYGRNNTVNKKAIEERRRVLFVSITRAKDKLYVTGNYAAYKDKESGDVYNQFLKEVFEITGTEYVPVDPEALIKQAKKLEEEAAKIKANLKRKAYSTSKTKASSKNHKKAVK